MSSAGRNWPGNRALRRIDRCPPTSVSSHFSRPPENPMPLAPEHPNSSALPLRSGPQGPLSGLRVLDLSAYIAGPYGCALLADQGAEVIKIEPPTGDNLRQSPSTLAAESRAFVGVNRSKIGIVLDLKQPADHALLMALVRTADVLVHNFRPGVPQRLGSAYEQLRPLNPRLVHCSVTGYGESGPLKDKAGYGQVLQTMTGMCTLQGKRGQPPEILYGSGVGYPASALVAAGVASARAGRQGRGPGPRGGVPWGGGCRSGRGGAGASGWASRCCAPRWPCSRRGWSGPKANPGTWGATCVRAASPASTRPRRAISTSRPTRPISGARCVTRWACPNWPPTSATTRCANAPGMSPNSCPGCTKPWRHAARP